ncbi:MAG: Holliday junction resolvase-like protein [Bacteriovoracia bacterium]
MKSTLRFFSAQRSVIAVCPRAKDFFRLSDVHVCAKGGNSSDWLTTIQQQTLALERREDRIGNIEFSLREKARIAGRKQAALQIKKVDKLFTPRGLKPQDAKPLLNPVDFVVFRNLNSGQRVSSIHLLDQKTKSATQLKIQRSICHAVTRGFISWVTIRVGDAGEISHE